MERRRRRSHFERRVRAGGERIRKREWVDPFPGVRGTIPEKMVLAELVFRRIPFYFQYNIVDVPFVKGIENWRVDFYIPAGKIVLEVNGYYWHSKQEKIASDAFRYAALETAGYKVVPWWDFDILSRLWQLFESVPELARPLAYGPPLKMTNEDDDVRAIRVINARRRSRILVSYRKSSRRRSRRGR